MNISLSPVTLAFRSWQKEISQTLPITVYSPEGDPLTAIKYMTGTFIIPLRHLGGRHDCNDDVGSYHIYYAARSLSNWYWFL